MSWSGPRCLLPNLAIGIRMTLFRLSTFLVASSVASSSLAGGVLSLERADDEHEESDGSRQAPDLPDELRALIFQFLPGDEIRRLGRADPSLARYFADVTHGAQFVCADARSRVFFAADHAVPAGGLAVCLWGVAPGPLPSTFACLWWDSRNSSLELRIWDAASKSLVGEWPIKLGEAPPPRSPPESFTSSNDGARVAFVLPAEGKVVVLDAVSGKFVAVFDDYAARRVSFSPDAGSIVIGGLDGTIRVINLTSMSDRGEPIGTHDRPVTGVAFLPNGAYIMTTSDDGTVCQWDISQRKKVRCFSHRVSSRPWWHPRTPGAMSRHAIAASEELLGDWWSGFEPGASIGLSVSPRGDRLIAAYSNGTYRVWSVDTGDLIGSIPAIYTPTLFRDNREGPSIAFSPDGRRVALSSFNSCVSVWDPEAILSGPIASPQDANGKVQFSRDGNHFLSVSSTWRRGPTVHTVAPWLYSQREYSDPSYWYLRDGGLATQPSNPGPRELEQRVRGAFAQASVAYTSHFTFDGSSETPQGMALSKDGTRVAIASLNELIVFDIRSGNIIRTIAAPHGSQLSNPRGSVVFSDDGNELVSSMDAHHISRFDIESGAVIRHFSLGLFYLYGTPRVAALFEGGAEYAVERSSGISIADGMAGMVRRHLRGSAYYSDAVTTSKDGQILAARHKTSDIEVYDTSSGAWRWTLHRRFASWLRSSTESAVAMAFGRSPRNENELAVAYSDGAVGIWNVDVGSRIREFTPDGGRGWGVTTLAVSPDGTRLAIGRHDLTVDIVDMTTGQRMGTYDDNGDPRSPPNRHPLGVKALAFSPDGYYLVSLTGRRLVVRKALMQ